ncbi:hypothetical protein H1R20_g16014, partial [Candolleomyces eurysporus]
MADYPAIPMHPLGLPASGSGIGGSVPPSGAYFPSLAQDDVQAQDGVHSNERTGRSSSESRRRRENIRLGKRPEHKDEELKDDETPWSSDDPRVYPFPKAEAKPESDAWAVCFDLGRKYDKERCDAWRDEVDKLLLFAALFSAVVTAFTVESYKLLEVDHEESTAVLLFSIQQQLDNLVRQNTSAPPLLPNPKAAFKAPPYAVHVNVCWFLSLMLSLSTVSIGILCLQWLREYQREANVAHQDAISLRYLRFNGLERWKVPSIIAGLPLLLQGALILFFAGMVIFLWNTNKPVAIVVATAVSTTVFFLLLTTILPPIQALISRAGWMTDVDRKYSQCPYKSPQAWAIRPIVVWIAIGVSRAFLSLQRRLKVTDEQVAGGQVADEQVIDEKEVFWNGRAEYFRKLMGARDWSDNDMIIQHSVWASTNPFVPLQDLKHATDARGTALGLAWIANMSTQNIRAIYAFIHCAQDMAPHHGKGMLRHMFTEEMGPNALAFVTPYNDTSPDRLSDAMNRDIFMAYALDYFALRNGQLRKPFLKYRFELLMRILNGAETYLPDDETPAMRARYCIPEGQLASMYFAYEQGKDSTMTELPRECRIQYFETVWLYINTVRVQHVGYLLAEGAMCLHLVVPGPPGLSSPLQMEPEILERAVVLNQRLEDFISIGTSSLTASEVDTLHEKLAKAITYAARVFNTIESGRHSPMKWDAFSLELNNPHYTESFVSLVRAIHSQTLLSEVGMPDALLIEKDRQAWTRLKASLIPGTVSKEEQAVAEADKIFQDQMAQLQRTFRSLGMAPLDLGNSTLGLPPSNSFISPSVQNV